MRKASTCFALCLFAVGFSGAGAGAQSLADALNDGCPAVQGSTLAQFEACAPAALKIAPAAPVAAPAEIAAPARIAPPVVIKAPVLVKAPVPALAPVRAVEPIRVAAPVRAAKPVRVATIQPAVRKTKRLTMIPWLVGAYQ